MKSNALSILFLVQKSKVNSQGKCPIRCRVTLAKKRKEFSTGLFIEPKNWDSKNQIVKTSDGSKFINDSLILILQNLRNSYLKLKIKSEHFSAEDIILDYKGETIQEEKGVIEVYNIHSRRLKNLVGRDIKEVTYSKYLESGNHLQDFIKWKFKSNDIKIKTLNLSFLSVKSDSRW